MGDSRALHEIRPAPGALHSGRPWRAAIVLPDPAWERAEPEVPGMRRSEHLLLTLARYQVERVILVGAPASVRASLAASPRRGAMPRCEFVDALPAALPLPAIVLRGGTVMDSRLLGWWAEQLRDSRDGVLRSRDGLPLALSRSALPEPADLDPITAGDDLPRFDLPEQHLCLSANDAGHGRQFLLCTKSRERWIVRVVQRACFPVIAALARRGVTPSQITWLSLAVAVLGALVLALGGHAGAIAGALLLAASRWLDILDGSLARLTHVASPAGARLDTACGRIATAATALALGWAAFGARGAWTEGTRAVCVLLLGGVLATVASHRADRVPRAHRPPWLSRVRRVLDYALHREYTLVLLIFAIAGDLAAFVWLAVAVAYLSTAVDVAFLVLASTSHRRGSDPTSRGSDSRCPR